MLNITYAPSEAALAEKLQQDLSQVNLELNHHFLIVLITPESSNEATVEKAIKDALANGHKILPLMVRQASLPEPIRHLSAFDIKNGYRINRVVGWLKNTDESKRTQANNRAFFGLGLIVLVMFSLSSFALATGTIAFPRDEYDEANATIDAERDELLQPTLDVWQPRSTEEAANFPATVEAVGTRYRPFIIMTATAIAPSNFEDEASTTEE